MDADTNDKLHEINAALHEAVTVALESINVTLGRMRHQIDQQAHRLGSVEQSLSAARQDAAEARELAFRPSSSTDRALAYLMGLGGAVLLRLEPNGQAVAYIATGAYLFAEPGPYSADWLRSAHAEPGERAGGALVSLAAYVSAERQDEFAGYAGYMAPPAPIIAVRQIRGEDDRER